MTNARTRVVVTGAAGRLGSTVAGLFHAEGFDVTASDIVDPGDVAYRFEVVDLRDHRAAVALIAGSDVVLHIGNHPGIGDTPPQVVFNENVAINENVFQGAAECGVRTVLFASTIQLIGSKPDLRTVVSPPPRPKFPVDGTTPASPANVYSLSKTVSEVMLRYYAERCGVAATALRLPLLHHWESHFTIEVGEENVDDIHEGFTGLTYLDAARLFLAVVRADLDGYHVFTAGSAHRHIGLPLPDLIRTFYDDVDPDVADLIDLEPVAVATGWRPSPSAWESRPLHDTHPGG